MKSIRINEVAVKGSHSVDSIKAGKQASSAWVVSWIIATVL
jgi:hypothetical protein